MSKEVEEYKPRFVNIEMASQDSPTFKPVRQGENGYISYGEKNDYPSYIIDLYNRCAEHKSAINKKTNYIFGGGLCYEKSGDIKTDAKIEKFLNNANPFQSWNKLLPKSIKAKQLINGVYFQFVYGSNGKIVSVYNIDFTRIRKSIHNKGYWYCEDWSDPKQVKNKAYYREYSSEIKTGSCIYYHKVDSPSATKFGDTYSIPSYSGALSAIETEINIDVFFCSLSANGMTAQGMLSLFNGAPVDSTAEKAIKRLFDKNYTGPKKAGNFILNFLNPDGKPAELLNFSTSDLDKQFEIVGKRNILKISVGHEADPVLLGIDNATSWSRPQLVDKFEKFQNEYTFREQEFMLEVVRLVAENNGVSSEAIYFEQLPPLGEELDITENTLKDVLTVPELRNYLRTKKNIELSSIDDESATSRLSVAQKLGVGGLATLQALLLDSSKTPEEKLPMLINVYGINEKKSQKILGILPVPVLDTEGNPVAMSAVQDKIFERFKELAKDGNDDEIVNIEFINGDPAKYEAKQQFRFAEVLGGTIKEVRNQILDLLAGDPFIKPEIIAKQLGTDVEYVNEQITQLKSQGVLESNGEGFNITSKGLNRAENVEPVIELEIYTVWQYALSPKADYSNLKGYIETSHDFCIKMMKLANAGKVWTRESIDSLSNYFDQNAWVYRGGVTRHKDGDVTDYCNHVWKAITKKRRKNG